MEKIISNWIIYFLALREFMICFETSTVEGAVMISLNLHQQLRCFDQVNCKACMFETFCPENQRVQRVVQVSVKTLVGNVSQGIPSGCPDLPEYFMLEVADLSQT